jgi:hypothetical protein
MHLGSYYYDVRVPYSCLLISNKFCNGGSQSEQGDQVPLYTCSSTPLSMGPETSLVDSCAENHLCTYDLYSPVHNVLDACISITWASGGGCINHSA